MKRRANRVARIGPLAGDVVKAAFSASVNRLLDHEPGVLRGRSAEALHQARVAVRRLRSDLRTFRPLVDRAWSRALLQELRWLGDELGAVRDLDVLLERLRRDAERAGAAGGDPDVAALLDKFRAERTRSRAALLDALRSARYARLRDRVASAARAPELTLAARLPARKGVVSLVRKRWKRLRAAVAALTSPPSARGLHRVRIKAKRCRYAAEAIAPNVGRVAQRFADAAADVQDVLGELHDAGVACARLSRLRRNPATAIAATALLAMEREAALRAREAWPHAWSRLSSKELRAWF